MAREHTGNRSDSDNRLDIGRELTLVNKLIFLLMNPRLNTYSIPFVAANRPNGPGFPLVLLLLDRVLALFPEGVGPPGPSPGRRTQASVGTGMA
jgi:hypothetical protein